MRGRAGGAVAGVATLLAAAVAVAGCSTGTPPAPGAGGRPLLVVAAEDMWGSVAAQLGGDRVHVTSIVDSPDADPHDYEPTPADGRAIASADVVLSNGIGYDTWAQRLADANPNPARADLVVGDVVGVRVGGNPHRWYDPADVWDVARAVTAAYVRLDPAHASTYRALATTFDTSATAAYRGMLAQIRDRFAGTPVGASESIVAMLTPALGLDLLTPPRLLAAVSQGTDPTAADKAQADAQIAGHQIRVYVQNSQNSTPDVQRQVEEARAVGIPVTTVTETMVPATARWQDWQTAQLEALRDALARATGR